MHTINSRTVRQHFKNTNGQVLMHTQNSIWALRSNTTLDFFILWIVNDTTHNFSSINNMCICPTYTSIVPQTNTNSQANNSHDTWVLGKQEAPRWTDLMPVYRTSNKKMSGWFLHLKSWQDQKEQANMLSLGDPKRRGHIISFISVPFHEGCKPVHGCNMRFLRLISFSSSRFLVSKVHASFPARLCHQAKCHDLA